MSTRFRCPICDQTVTVLVPISPRPNNPYCTHHGTPQSGHRPKAMNPEETKK